jgi:phosphonate utilization associated putative membrane protein
LISPPPFRKKENKKMSWFVMMAILAGAMLHAGWNVLVKSSKDKTLETAIIHLFCSLLAMPFFIYLGMPPQESWPFLAASILIHLGYYFALSQAYHRGELGLTYPLMRGTAPLLVAVGSLLFLGDPDLSWVAWAGIVSICAGVLLLGMSAGLMKHRHAISIALLNAAIIAVYTLVDAQGIRLTEDPLQYIAALFALDGWLFALWVLFIRKGQALRYTRERWPIALGGAAASVTSYAIALWAMTVAPVAAVAALRETSVLFAALFGAWFLNEKLTRNRVVGVFVIIGGAMAVRLA